VEQTIRLVELLSTQMSQTMAAVGKQADKGTVIFLYALGGTFLSFGLLFRVLSAITLLPVRFMMGDYALTLGVGLVLLIAGAGVKLYEFRIAMENYRSAIKFTREREIAAMTRTDDVVEPVLDEKPSL
jgi:hypothetical protein